MRDAIAGALDSMTLADLVPRIALLGGSGLPIMPTLADPSSTVGIAAPTVTAAD